MPGVIPESAQPGVARGTKTKQGKSFLHDFTPGPVPRPCSLPGWFQFGSSGPRLGLWGCQGPPSGHHLSSSLGVVPVLRTPNPVDDRRSSFGLPQPRKQEGWGHPKTARQFWVLTLEPITGWKGKGPGRAHCVSRRQDAKEAVGVRGALSPPRLGSFTPAGSAQCAARRALEEEAAGLRARS